jgi:hypothetical protein
MLCVLGLGIKIVLGIKKFLFCAFGPGEVGFSRFLG